MIPDELLGKDVSWLTKVSYYFTVKPNRLNEFKSRFIIEKGKGRAQVYLKSLTERQTHVGPVYRNQQKSLGYEDFFNNGMSPKGSHDNLLMHTESNTTVGNFISTTLDKDIATQFGSLNGWVFEIRSTNGIDNNKTLGADALHPGQLEVSIPDVILPKDIKGVWQKQGGVLTTWIQEYFSRSSAGGGDITETFYKLKSGKLNALRSLQTEFIDHEYLKYTKIDFIKNDTIKEIKKYKR